jgi:hypothetical protein
VNPRYRGLARMTIAVRDAEQAVADYRAMFDFGGREDVTDDPPGSRGVVLALADSPLRQHIVFAEPTSDGELSRRLEQRGEGIFSFGIAVSDLTGELDRLAALEPRVEVAVNSDSTRATIDPEALRGLRVELLSID